MIVRDHRELAWKSMLHHDGTMYDGMFIVGVETPGGQATYHYDVDPYWELFDCDELDRAPEWDGHTPAQAIDRIAALRPSCDREALLALAEALCDGYPYGLSHGGLEQLARRIREACGEAANGLPTERLGEAPLCAEKRQDRDVASGSAEGGAHEKN